MARRKLSTFAAIALLLALCVQLLSSAATVSAESPANPAFQRTWDRTDNPVANGQVPGGRTWMWGPEANTGALQEEYAQGAGQMRTVQYYDKSRMEINHDPNVEQNSIWYVTNGLLVVELVTGRLKTGDLGHEYDQYPPSTAKVAGDQGDANGPTYATFQNLMDVHSGLQLDQITQVIDREGNITIDATKALYDVPTVHFVAETRHWIAEPFWNFMNADGLVYQNGGYVTDKLFDNPYYATGFPISEPYWANIKVANVQRDVLMQCFERRCLTYTPSNAPEWQVEMGNVGQHYYTWRYEEIPLIVSDPCPETVAGTYVWVADTVNDRVQKFTESGTYLCELNPANTGSKVIEPWAIAVDPNTNDLWVHVDGWLHRFDYRGNWIFSFGDNQLVYEDIAVDSAGNVYGVDAVNSRIRKYAPDGDLLMEWGSFGDIQGELTSPAGIDVDDDGTIFVVDRVTQRVTVYTPTGAYSHFIGSNNTLYFPDAVTVGSNGYVYVTDVSIYVFDPTNGALLDTWESTDAWSAQYGIAIGANGYVYALDRINAAVNYFNENGTRLGGWGTAGDEPGEFNTTNSLTTSTR